MGVYAVNLHPFIFLLPDRITLPRIVAMENVTASLDNQPLLLTRTSAWSLWPWQYNYFLLLLLVYPFVTAFFRHDRLRKSRKTFNSISSQHMTDDDACLIQQYLIELEFPFAYEKALQFALFRSYGIPSISKLLVGTSQFTNPETSSKRYADTELLIREFVGHAPRSERTIEAISRMNYIHSKYRLSGQILDDDMLFTLSLFASEPIKWINKYEWRQLEDFEKCAIGTFWKSMGDAMSISFDSLKSGKVGFTDGLQWLEEVLQWAEHYEKKNMVPHINNKITADETVSLLLWNIPPAIKDIGENLVKALMDARLRAAMMYFKYSNTYISPLPQYTSFAKKAPV